MEFRGMSAPYRPFYGEGGVSKYQKRRCLLNRMNLLVGSVLGVGFVLTLLNIYQLQQMREEHIQHQMKTSHPITIVEATAGKASKSSPVVWIHGKKKDSAYLDHIKAVFLRLGFHITEGDDDWDVMWVHDYPFITMSYLMTHLQPHQRVNHYPGSGYITNKGSLTTLQLDAFPKCFRIPQDKEKLFRHAKENPEKLWVQKSNNHRGIRIKQLDELDYNTNGTFVQEFVSRPLLIDDKKFDIGVYTIMTSLNPLRVYIVNDDALFRFCAKQYYPFDVKDVGKYVVGDDYTPVWKMPSLQGMYVDERYSFKETFNRYMTHSGRNVSKVWADIDDTIRAVYLKKQPMLISTGTKYKTTRNFFELVRFDFVLDEILKLYLMEVNMSPNLSTSHFKGNKRLYEHVVYSTLRVARVGSMLENQFHNSDRDTDEMLASDREITVFSDWCMKEHCQGECLDVKCSLCNHCLSDTQRTTFKDAYLEHINRAGCRRIFPPSIDHAAALRWSPRDDFLGVLTYSEKNRQMYMWFIGMCRKDPSFCV